MKVEGSDNADTPQQGRTGAPGRSRREFARGFCRVRHLSSPVLALLPSVV